jgi:hypothetical protein
MTAHVPLPDAERERRVVVSEDRLAEILHWLVELNRRVSTIEAAAVPAAPPQSPPVPGDK